MHKSDSIRFNAFLPKIIVGKIFSFMFQGVYVKISMADSNQFKCVLPLSQKKCIYEKKTELEEYHIRFDEFMPIYKPLCKYSHSKTYCNCPNLQLSDIICASLHR